MRRRRHLPDLGSPAAVGVGFGGRKGAGHRESGSAPRADTVTCDNPLWGDKVDGKSLKERAVGRLPGEQVSGLSIRRLKGRKRRVSRTAIVSPVVID